MHRTESDDLTQCMHCGAEISIAVDRTYAVTDQAGLCFACAVARGGSYDEAHDTWTRLPTLAGLPSARE